ncbi:DUF402 domain-containing protein [Kribbella sp. NPDC048915]|uniref:DUF402 domain-containing protein n=1 Tax=Kribbella sp. NPDC048915 TaxID=3155148 RepID=UPI0034042B16
MGRVVGYDVRILPQYQVAGRPTVDRSYLLLDEGVQVTKPVVFTGALEGWWYVDLVEIERTGDGLVVHDLYADVMIPPAGDQYRILDLDELGEALRAGQLTAARCADVLVATQRFMDRYLPRADGKPTESEFPPPEVVELEGFPSFL